MEHGEFVILEHDPTPAAQRGTAAALAVHWDLMLTQAATERLATWRLTANPLVTVSPIAVSRIADHRRDFLTYEGELTGDRGRVKRVDRGTYARRTDGELELRSPAGRRRYRWETGPEGWQLTCSGALGD